MGSQNNPDFQLLLNIAYRMALRWCRSPSEAEDIAQEAMIRYVTTAPAPERPAAWLHVVVRRLRNRTRMRDLAREAAEAEFGAGRDAVRVDVDLYLDFDRVLSKLSERQRRVIALLASGAQSREIAAAFGVSVRDVGQMVARARKVARRVRNGDG